MFFYMYKYLKLFYYRIPYETVTTLHLRSLLAGKPLVQCSREQRPSWCAAWERGSEIEDVLRVRHHEPENLVISWHSVTVWNGLGEFHVRRCERLCGEE